MYVHELRFTPQWKSSWATSGYCYYVSNLWDRAPKDCTKAKPVLRYSPYLYGSLASHATNRHLQQKKLNATWGDLAARVHH